MTGTQRTTLEGERGGSSDQGRIRPVGGRLGALLVLLTVAAFAVLALGPVQSGGATVADSPPTWPIPPNAPPGPPPIPQLPAATDTAPSTDVIVDPITPAASCGGWYRQTSYGNHWATTSNWWEYQCVDDQYTSYNPCQVGACDAFCPYCWEQTQNTTDYFYWDGSKPVLYGQEYYYVFDYYQTDDPPQVTDAWWDAPTSEWWNLGPFPLTLSTAGSGSGEVTETPQGENICTLGLPDCGPSFDAGTVVTLSAAPDPGATFTGWSGDCSGAGDCQVTMNQARSVTATFTAKAFRLTVTKQGNGSGQVSSNPAGISSCSLICQASFDVGSTVTLTATADAGSTFAGWSGDCSGSASCQVTMSQALSVTATFVPNTFTLSVSKTGAGTGTVASSPPGISCGTGCQASFAAGTSVTLTATPGAGSNFTGWSGDCSGTEICQVALDQARTVSAAFAPNIPPHAAFTVACAGLTCTFDASGSSDPDGSITSYAWSFGDGTTGTGAKPSHTYGRPSSYTATVTVTDNAGATAGASKAFNPISLSARGYKQNGGGRVDLSWSGPSGTNFDVYRSGSRIATVPAASYSDTVSAKAGSEYTYKVCGNGNCSNDVTVSF